MIKLKSYLEAVKNGDLKYQGGPCKHGHTSGIRYTRTGEAAK